MFRDVLVHVDGSEAAPARVRLAIGICQASKARLTGLHVTPPTEVPPVYKPSQIRAASEALEADLLADAQSAAAMFQHETTNKAVETAWLSVEGDVAPEVSLAARYADLVIVGQYEWQSPTPPHPLPVAHAIVTHCGRPLLVVPAAQSTQPMASAIIAWDGSRECVRAVHDAIPLLRGMRWISVVTIDHPGNVDVTHDASLLSAHLGRHGIKVELSSPAQPIAGEHKTLLATLAEAQCDLLVMGAYSRPEWFEFLFGGATLSILLYATMPVLISH